MRVPRQWLKRLLDLLLNYLWYVFRILWLRCPLCARRSRDWTTVMDLSSGEAVWVCRQCEGLVKKMREAE